MATETRREQPKAAQPYEAAPRGTPKVIVIECGVPEQGDSAESVRQRSDGRKPEDVLRELEQEEYRYGGTPVGSDPRE